MTVENDFFFRQLMRHPLIELHLSYLLQMPIDCSLVNIGFFSNFLCNCQRIRFDGCSQFVTANFPWLATALLILKALISFAKLLEPSLHCPFVSIPGPNVVLML